MRFFILLSFVFSIGAATPALAAYKVKCNEEQTTCEVDTKRLVTGDRVGIFDEDGLIVAIGTVKRLKGRVRVVQIDKKYATIRRDHELSLIKDEEAQNPRQYFKFYKESPKQAFGGTLGLLAMGIGEGMTAIDGQGYMQWKFRNDMHLVGRGMFITGSGRAAHNDGVLQSEDLSLTVFGVMGGASYLLFPQKALSFRFEGGLGFGQVNASISGGKDVKEFVDGRIKPGMAPIIRLEAAAIYHWNGWQPMVQASILRLQNSNNTGVGAGALFNF